ncbi:ISOEUGENOL SYNTHASE 1-LIKE [Salix koriyanagi]|uniref:ISOEUGENOL SYNTHASE 1-LIKE n=1 Tax=Salix koriyanagi TaxID=2511006 RepID=A0A9Q0UPR9_9ROSI|nr:ISOEUGENOL SYNTHASE 1-LIKE [Salix koriyanagi]
MACEKSRILIFGATGYLGSYMVKASLSMGHPTYAYVRPDQTLHQHCFQARPPQELRIHGESLCSTENWTSMTSLFRQ